MNDAYQLLLDLYPLLETFPSHESRNLVERIRVSATDLALGKGCVEELRLLLQISHDLGYLEEAIVVFLLSKLT